MASSSIRDVPQPDLVDERLQLGASRSDHQTVGVLASDDVVHSHPQLGRALQLVAMDAIAVGSGALPV